MSKKITSLFLSANPKKTASLRLDEEIREIEDALKRSQCREMFDLHKRSAVRPRDIGRAMLDLDPTPNIVHFSGHGQGIELNQDDVLEDLVDNSTEEGLIFEDETGENLIILDGKALAGLLSPFSDTVQVVVMNCCFSASQARAIAEEVPYVIGMLKGIGDKAAIAFSTGFYDALGAGRSIGFAFDYACKQILAIRNSESLLGSSEYLTPVIVYTNDSGCIEIKGCENFEPDQARSILFPRPMYPASHSTKTDISSTQDEDGKNSSTSSHASKKQEDDKAGKIIKVTYSGKNTGNFGVAGNDLSQKNVK